MRGCLALTRHSLRRSRALVLVMLVVLASFEVLLVVSADALQRSGTFGGLAAMVPPFFREIFGDAVLSLMSYTGLVAFGYFHPVIMAALVGLAITIGTEVASDVETRFVDVVLARPLPRSALIARSALLVMALPALLVAAMLTASFVSLRAVGPAGAGGPKFALLAGLAVNLWAVILCAGGASLAIAAIARRRSTAVGIAAVALLSAFLVEYLARMWSPLTRLSWLSPFHYYDAMSQVLGGPLPIDHLAALVTAGLAGIALALVLFSRRDM